jgi:hypothetical protein
MKNTEQNKSFPHCYLKRSIKANVKKVKVASSEIIYLLLSVIESKPLAI